MMTDDIESLKPGFQEDLLVAKKFFQFTDESVEDGARGIFNDMRQSSRGAGMVGDETYEKDCEDWRKEAFRRQTVPCYSSNSIAAIELVSLLTVSYGYRFLIQFNQDTSKFVVAICNSDNALMSSGHCTSFQDAVCKAALSLVPRVKSKEE